MTGVYELERPGNFTGRSLNQGAEYHESVAESLNFSRVLGVLGGQDLSTEWLGVWARSADVLLAADGGANLLFEQGIIPAAAIGDLDSIDSGTRSNQTKVLYLPDQNSSDCDKLLAYAEDCGYSSITLCGIEGDQLDHVLGGLQSAARSKLNVRLALRRGLAWMLRGPIESSLSLPEGTRLSLIPITPCEGVGMDGVEWPLKGSALHPLGLTSLSNRALGPVTVRIGTGVAALIASQLSLEFPQW